jgi:ABC-2 type transport system permease protein
MPIFDQGYQHWQGELSGRGWRWWTITRRGVRAQMKNRWLRLVVLMAWVPALALALWLVVWGLLENKSELIMPLFRGLGLPPRLLDETRAYRVASWTTAYHIFFLIEINFALVLVLIVGPNLISQDLRFNAFPLYFSRPLRRFDYFMGKLGVIAVFLAAVAIVPAVLAYLLGVIFSLDLSIVPETVRYLAASILYGLVVVVSAGMLVLALSSLSRNSRYVGMFWVGLWMLSDMLAGMFFALFQSNWYPLVSYKANLQKIGITLFDTGAGLQQWYRSLPADAQEQVLHNWLGPPYPWYWSALVLAGLFGLSLWILSSRVRSLDRLR